MPKAVEWEREETGRDSGTSREMARRRQRRQSIQDQGIHSLEEALEQLDVHALKFVFLTKSWPLKLLWLIFFLGGLAAAIYYVREILSKYQLGQTATKISANIQEVYDYPPIFLCPRFNWDLEKSDKAGLSREAVSLAASLIQDNETNRPLPPLMKNIFQAEGELQSFINRNLDIKPKTYAEFYKWMAPDFRKVVQHAVAIPGLQFKPVFVATPTDDTKPVDYRVCFNVTTSKYDPHSGEQFFLQYNIETANDFPYGFDRDFVVIKDDHRVVREKDRLYLRNNRITTIRVQAKEFTKQWSKTETKCKAEDETGQYSQSHCRLECLEKEVKRCSDCVLMMEKTELIGSHLLCTWATHRNLNISCGEIDYWKEHYKRCKRKCQPFCKYMSYDFSQTAVVINPDQYNDSRVGLAIDFAVEDGIMAYEEIYIYDIESMVSNIGGLFGLWTGASLLTIIELAYLLTQCFCANWELKKEERRRRRAESIRKNSVRRSISPVEMDQQEADQEAAMAEETEEDEEKKTMVKEEDNTNAGGTDNETEAEEEKKEENENKSPNSLLSP